MKKTTLVFSFVFVFLFVFVSAPTRIFAATLFYDDFSSGGMDKWSSSVGDTTWSLVSGDERLMSEVLYRQQSYLLAKETYDFKDYEFSVNVENVSGIDQHFLFRASADLSEFYQIELRYPDSAWPQDPASNVRLWRYKQGGYTRLAADTPFPLSKEKVFRLKIVVKEFNIKIYVDDLLVIEVTDSPDGILKGGIGLHGYAGDYRPGKVVNYYDDVSVIEIGSVVQNKIIFLPGLGASWNTEAMVYNRPVSDDAWVMTPFVKNYDGLINILTKKGLVRDRDFFVWNYDWRRPMSEVVDKLNTFINLKIGSSEKVDLVGHSFGGVVARIWSQDRADSPKLGKVMTLGSPNAGLTKAYEWWNGTKISGDNDAGSIALSILYQLNRRNLQSDVEVLRNYAPSLKDVLPVFDFAKRNNVLVSSDSLTTKNTYLKSKNSTVDQVYDRLKTVAGVGQNTVEALNLGERTVFDKVLNKWPDGVPINQTFGQGDGSVLKKSAVFANDLYEERMSNHGSIIDKSIDIILAELGIGGTSNEPVYEMGNKAMFFIGSPAYLSVKCGTDSPTLSDSSGFVVTSNLNDCLVNIIGTGNGIYHLVTGKTNDENSWRYFEDNISVGETRVMLISGGALKSDVANLDYLYRLVKYDLVKLQSQYPGNVNLTTSMTATNAKQINNLMTGVFNFRKEKKESLLSGAIVKNIETILAIENRNLSASLVKSAYVKAVQSKSLVDRTTRLYVARMVNPSVFGAESYRKLEEMLVQNGNDYAKSILAVKFASEVW